MDRSLESFKKKFLHFLNLQEMPSYNTYGLKAFIYSVLKVVPIFIFYLFPI